MKKRHDQFETKNVDRALVQLDKDQWESGMSYESVPIQEKIERIIYLSFELISLSPHLNKHTHTQRGREFLKCFYCRL